MMTAAQVIESYVRDVARYLPRDRRDDVAFELRSLLDDELRATAESERRAPDATTAIAILTRFGRPAEAAARYRPRPPLIDPADNHNFLIWAVVGALVVAAANPGSQASVLGWVGLVFVWFALAAWVRRRRGSGRMRWRPRRERFPAVASRPLSLLAALGSSSRRSRTPWRGPGSPSPAA